MSLDRVTLPLAEAAAACYAPGAVPTWQSSLRLVHVFHSVVLDTNCFAFEGTTDWQEWVVDFFAVQVPVFDHMLLGPVHAGFLLNVESILGDIIAKLSGLGWPPFYLAGHSKGAGEAILCHALLKAIGHPPLATRVFEPPRVGGTQLKSFLAGDDLIWTQTWNAEGSDLVTLVPDGLTWCHDGQVLRLQVPDTYGLAEKHRIPAVLEALSKVT